MKKIAVVEDNPDNRLLVRVILETLYQVSEYENGVGALQGLASDRPDVLLLDISLPEMDGVEVLGRIRANPALRNLPVIALTAHAMAGDREKYLGLGFNDYVSKPIVDEAVLLNAIDRLLHSEKISPAPPPGDPSPLDGEALERLRKLGGDSFAAEMIGVFLEFTAQKIAQGRRASDAGDRLGVEKAMHPIKSSAGNVGASRIQELAARIEALAKQPNGEPLGNSLTEIEDAFQQARTQFELKRQTFLAK